MSVSPEQRFTRNNPCPVCQGHCHLPSGQGLRCYGYFSDDGDWAYCTREETSGDAPWNANVNGYLHKLSGECRCGNVHGVKYVYGPSRAPRTDPRLHAEVVWKEAVNSSGTLAEIYLKSRAITLPIPPSLRFSPNLWHTEARKELPAMVGKVTKWPGEDVAAIHRTYLKVDGSGKAEVMTSKKSLGPVRGGTVRLSKPGLTLALSEGIETGLSVRQETGLPVWVALSSSNLANTILPDLPLAQKIVICADPDAAGQKAAYFAAEKWTLEGRVVRIATPPDNRDFNDLLRQKGIAG